MYYLKFAAKYTHFLTAIHMAKGFMLLIPEDES